MTANWEYRLLKLNSALPSARNEFGAYSTSEKLSPRTSHVLFIVGLNMTVAAMTVAK
jgi:hypothetical protein